MVIKTSFKGLSILSCGVFGHLSGTVIAFLSRGSYEENLWESILNLESSLAGDVIYR